MIGARPSGARPLVLIADDEPDIRRFLRMQLENVDVIEASDGAEALELARLRRPQLALLDHMMPEMDGVEVCRRIRENHTTRGVAVIILTARADEHTKLSALQAGANDFLTKPFSTAELALRLENQIAMARIRREMADLNTELQSALDQIKENEVLMVRNEKLSALGRMSAGIIHEINNPLNYASAGLHALETFTKVHAGRGSAGLRGHPQGHPRRRGAGFPNRHRPAEIHPRRQGHHAATPISRKSSAARGAWSATRWARTSSST